MKWGHAMMEVSRVVDAIEENIFPIEKIVLIEDDPDIYVRVYPYDTEVKLPEIERLLSRFDNVHLISVGADNGKIYIVIGVFFDDKKSKSAGDTQNK